MSNELPIILRTYSSEVLEKKIKIVVEFQKACPPATLKKII